MIDLHLGDCLEMMTNIPSNSVDSCITDPPYGLSFMGKDWDYGIPGVAYWREVLRVLKPGAFLLAFGGTRTSHRLTCAIEDAGFEIRDSIAWIYGQGFPKSHDISKGIDKAAGAGRETVGHKRITGLAPDRINFGANDRSNGQGMGYRPGDIPVTAPATDLAQQWDGYGTALKPAVEPIVVAMKPLDGTFAANAERWGVAGLWIDGGRVEYNGNNERFGAAVEDYGDKPGGHWHTVKQVRSVPPTNGRWPANLILDEVTAEMLDEISGERPSGGGNKSPRNHYNGTFKGIGQSPNPSIGGDTGGASRFFYVAKASKSERGEGNDHPTVKPLALMRYLCRLTRTPSGGVVLDPFMGSGTTGIAAVMEGRDFIGIEKHPPYFEIAERRVGKAQPEPQQGALAL